jgi:hypothetical protein
LDYALYRKYHGKTPGGVAVMLFGMVAVFSFGGGFNKMAESGFFAPALQRSFILRENSAQKRAALMIWGNYVVQRSGIISTLLLFRW